MTVAKSQQSREFELLYHEHHSWLHNVLKRRLGNHADAADLAQDAFVRLWVKPKPLTTSQRARAYLSVIARGLCVDLWRRRQVEQAWLDTLAQHPEATAPSAEQQVAILEALSEIDHMLKRLPVKVSRAFIASMVLGKSGKEIAAELQVSERMVRNYLSHAMLECILLEARHFSELLEDQD